MIPQTGSSRPKALSLVYTFLEQLHASDDVFNAPEPDFGNWAETHLFADVATAGDNAMVEGLSEKDRYAWRVFAQAQEATGELLALYRNDPVQFRKLARELSFLPCLLSWHPDMERFNRELLAASELGQACMYGALRQHPAHAAQQPWPVRYAYAIMDTFALTLDTFGERLPLWAEVYGYGVKHPWPRERTEATLAKVSCDEAKKERIRKQYEGAYEVLPAWTQQLLALSRPLRPQNVLDYWRVGKAMILEELPDFHERPEWAEYRTRRKYAGGAKPGVIQHAIFKDILAALRTIAGAGRRRPRIRKAK